MEQDEARAISELLAVWSGVKTPTMILETVLVGDVNTNAVVDGWLAALRAKDTAGTIPVDDGAAKEILKRVHERATSNKVELGRAEDARAQKCG